MPDTTQPGNDQAGRGPAEGGDPPICLGLTGREDLDRLRAFVATLLDGQDNDLVVDVLVAVGELATLACEWGRHPEVRLARSADRGGLSVDVTTTRLTLPTALARTEADLRLLDTCTTMWGIARDAHQLRVWAEFSPATGTPPWRWAPWSRRVPRTNPHWN